MPGATIDCPPAQDGAARAGYTAAFDQLRSGRRDQNSRAVTELGPDWEGKRTFTLPVQPDSPAFSTDDPDPVLETLEELAALPGARARIALWVNDQIGALEAVRSTDQFRISISRIAQAKNPRLEAMLVSLAIRMNLSGNANGFAVAQHFGLTPQTIHEMLTETCAALGLPKPLSKINKSRYADTQYRHNLRKNP